MRWPASWRNHCSQNEDEVLRDDEPDVQSRRRRQHLPVWLEDVVLQRVHHEVRLRQLEPDRGAA